MTALVIKHHPKLLRRWAKNYVDWCLDLNMGNSVAKGRIAFLFDAETINKLKEPILEEFKRRGSNAS